MSDDAAEQLVSEMKRRAFQAAKTRGDVCAACGRALADGETVWLEHRPVPDEPRLSLRVPLGIECVSPDFLARTEGREPERCAGCGRGVYYGRPHSNRRQALCSKRCVARAVAAKKQQAKGEPA